MGNARYYTNYTRKTYVFIVVESVENVVRKTRKQINHEPRLQVIESDHFWIGDHLPTRANVGRVKVEYNVYEKYHVHDGVHDKEGDVF